MCNSVLFCRTALLYLGQVAVVNENLFSTGLPGKIKVIFFLNKVVVLAPHGQVSDLLPKAVSSLLVNRPTTVV